jgi:hypothetical protein
VLFQNLTGVDTDARIDTVVMDKTDSLPATFLVGLSESAVRGSSSW